MAEVIPGVQDYINALSSISAQVTAEQKKILTAHYNAPNRLASTLFLSRAAGKNSYVYANNIYGRLGHKLADALGYIPAKRPDGSPIWTNTLAIGSESLSKDGHFQWRLREEVAHALIELGWVSAFSQCSALRDLEREQPRLAQLEATERERVVQSRLGQGIFRHEVIKYWNSCAVTGCVALTLLRASHIKPWRDCDNSERLDPYNGLLLTPNIDAAFDAGMISFDTTGRLMLSNVLSQDDLATLSIHKGSVLRQFDSRHQAYLEYHRENVFSPGGKGDT